MADILYQPGTPGGGTLTTNDGAPPQLGQGPHVGFDMDWMKQLAQRKAQQEDEDRRFARKMMLRQSRGPAGPQNRISGGDNRGYKGPAQPEGEEMHVDTRTGLPSHAWDPNAMNTGRRMVRQGGQVTQSAAPGEPDAPDRWRTMEAMGGREQPDMNPGRGGGYTQATGRGGY